MSWYEQRVFNRFILDPSMDIPEVHAERALALREASGDVLEIGMGTGLNLADYPASVGRIASVGPEAALHPFAVRRAAERGLRVDHTEGDARRLPFDAARFDTAVCTFVLCTIPEPERAVREIRRVLRPSGKLLFLEHVVAASGVRRAAQRAFRAPMSVMLCGCEMTRDTERTLTDGGFAFRDLARYDLPAMAWLFRHLIRGVAEVAS
jgi:ubiquinone/menaquinone biosynthesis C-methylase UbiE